MAAARAPSGAGWRTLMAAPEARRPQSSRCAKGCARASCPSETTGRKKTPAQRTRRCARSRQPLGFTTMACARRANRMGLLPCTSAAERPLTFATSQWGYLCTWQCAGDCQRVCALALGEMDATQRPFPHLALPGRASIVVGLSTLVAALPGCPPIIRVAVAASRWRQHALTQMFWDPH
jgi:hypothetical protein